MQVLSGQLAERFDIGPLKKSIRHHYCIMKEMNCFSDSILAHISVHLNEGLSACRTAAPGPLTYFWNRNFFSRNCLEVAFWWIAGWNRLQEEYSWVKLNWLIVLDYVEFQSGLCQPVRANRGSKMIICLHRKCLFQPPDTNDLWVLRRKTENSGSFQRKKWPACRYHGNCHPKWCHQHSSCLW